VDVFDVKFLALRAEIDGSAQSFCAHVYG